MHTNGGRKMKVIIFGGTPGSGKTSIIKFIIQELKDLKIHYVKFDVLNTDDDKFIKQKFGISTENKISGEACPDHYTALEIPKIIKKHKDKDIIIIETAGLCLRCSPYIKEGLAVNVLNILAGKPSGYGPLLTDADVVVVSKGDLISQAEREIFRSKLLNVNKNALIIDGNGLTGEGSVDVAETIKKSLEIKKTLTLKHSMPTGICGYCYGNRILNPQETLDRYNKGKELKSNVPNLNCGECGFKSCNEFIRAVLEKKTNPSDCPYFKKEK
jgi:Ni2+-binding GTPase involved in maturation of urease and hydrogenase